MHVSIDDLWKWLQHLNLADQPLHLVLSVGDSAAVHDVGYGTMTNLSVRRMTTIT